MKVLVGCDQTGVIGSPAYHNFMDNYKQLADYDFTADPDEFIQMATQGQYNALVIDLNWKPADIVEVYRTGYRILDAVVDCCNKRILWTSACKELREKGFQHGATHCISKGIMPEDLEKILTE